VVNFQSLLELKDVRFFEVVAIGFENAQVPAFGILPSLKGFQKIVHYTGGISSGGDGPGHHNAEPEDGWRLYVFHISR